MSYTTNFAMNLDDESYNNFLMNGLADLPPPLEYEYHNMDILDYLSWGDDYGHPASGYISNDAPAEVAPATCNPAEVMSAPLGLNDILQDDWAETLGIETFNPTPAAVNPSQLMTPPQSLPSTPQNAARTLPLDNSNIGLITPPSDRPVYRTRRFGISDSIHHLSRLNLNTPSPVERAVNPGCLAASPAYTSSTPENPAMFVPLPLGYPPASSSTSSGTSSSISSGFRSSSSPIQRATRPTGVQRMTASELRRRNKNLQPVPTDDPERPHGCRHPGRNPGDLPCNLDFARKHDWSRHQRVHTGETPYICRGCDRPFKRPDARGRHWDSRPECESSHTGIVRGLLASGEMSVDDRDVPVLRRRAQKAEYRRESARTGLPISELKEIMRQVKNDDGFGF
ncbi:hypothetical protein FS749_000642 [Ceratobasidium sp. UAMH 11750]|nr:hypothetical protein FS749_000642 [Ceratobasidium sp. UAMH 11750]